MKILRAVRWLVGAVQALGELVGAGRKLANAARRGKLPLNDTDSIPLSPRQPLKPIVVPLRSGQKK